MADTDLDTRLSTALRERGQRVTSQRLVIHRTLQELDRHVTAEEVLSAVGDRLPGVALPTVYATLDLFEDLGVLRRVAVPGGPTLYDPRTAPHHHGVCTQCGRVQDLDLDVDLAGAVDAAGGVGFRAHHAEVVLTGVCAGCA